MLHEIGCTDGLPVIILTTELVDRMVLASGLDGDVVLGEVGPLGGVATVEKLAATVMAGCSPDYMPFVLAAMQAVLQPEFDLGGAVDHTFDCALTYCERPTWSDHRHRIGVWCVGTRASQTHASDVRCVSP